MRESLINLNINIIIIPIERRQSNGVAASDSFNKPKENKHYKDFIEQDN